jgi:hypothetical protein
MLAKSESKVDWVSATFSRDPLGGACAGRIFLISVARLLRSSSAVPCLPDTILPGVAKDQKHFEAQQYDGSRNLTT